MSARITWLGHATFQLILPDERVIYIDPWLAENPACPDQFKKPSRCDMVLLTHGHFDHVADVEPLIDAFDPIIIGNFDLCKALEKQLGKGRFSSMSTGGTQTVDGVNVSLTQAFHSSGLDSPDGPLYAGMPNGVVVDAEGVAAIYHAGDTDVFGDMQLIAKLFEPKVCILPIGGHFTMGAKGAALAVEMLNPTAVIPCHYGTFPILAPNVDEFCAAVPAEMKGRVCVAQIGKEIAWTPSGVE